MIREMRSQAGILAVMLLFWLAGYWFMYDGWWHRRLLWWTVAPAVAIQLPGVWQSLKAQRWLPVLLALLLYQLLSRLWASPPLAPVGSLQDTLAVALLLAAVVHCAKTLPPFSRLFPLIFTLISSTTALASLLLFYSAHSFTNDRLRNIFVYETGLNPVLTGLLCSFGTLCALSLVAKSQSKRGQAFWQITVGLQVFALFATQSRTAMLALGFGLAATLLFERKRLRPLLLPVLIGAAAQIVLLVALPHGGDAMSDLMARGSTGRFDIYRSFLGEMSVRDVFFGKGMGSSADLAEEVLGWPVAHPHSSYLTQFYLTGLFGSGLLLLILLRAGLQSLLHAYTHQSLWLALLLGHGLALLVDGGQIFSLASIPRIEFLLLAVPAVLVCTLPRPKKLNNKDNPERVPGPNPYDSPPSDSKTTPPVS